MPSGLTLVIALGIAVGIIAIGFGVFQYRMRQKKEPRHREKRICFKCDRPILRNHHFSDKGKPTVSHLDCERPTLSRKELAKLAHEVLVTAVFGEKNA